MERLSRESQTIPCDVAHRRQEGTDAHGRAMASGVYEVRLITEEGAVNKRVTLLR